MDEGSNVGTTMRAIRLHTPDGPAGLTLEEVQTPAPEAGEALVRVHAAAITRDELTWPVDRLPAIPSYELSGVVEALGSGADGVAIGDAVYALTPFDRDGAAADYIAVPANLLAPKPRALDHVQSAAVPLAALSAWQGLFTHGELKEGQRVIVTGAGGGVGHFAVQLARQAGAHVIGTASPAGAERARNLGAQEVFDPTPEGLGAILGPIDLVFDTAGGDSLTGSARFAHEGAKMVSIAEDLPEGVEGVYFVVEPDRAQLLELTRLIESGDLLPAIDSVFPLAEGRKAFERSMAGGKAGKVVLRVADD
jgi:NADPH:quinone reductase-like Zn-dependent oxidoreductase